MGTILVPVAMSAPQSTVAPAVAPQIARGRSRQFPLPSCLLTPSDLRRLYRLLQPKADEAADRQVATLLIQPGQTPQQFEELKTAVRNALVPVIRLQTNRGEWINATTADILEDEQLPESITKLEFDSAILHRTKFNNLFPNNWFNVTLDFGRTNILEATAIPEQNTSSVSINGLDATWANAVYDELFQFFRQYRARRGWIHGQRIYDVLRCSSLRDSLYHSTPYID